MSKRQKLEQTISSRAIVYVVVFVALVAIFFNYSPPNQIKHTSPLSYNDIDYHVNEACKSLPSIRPSGSYFLDRKIQDGSSSEGIAPAFHVGSYYAEKVPYHMKGDATNFQLIKEALQGKNNGWQKWLRGGEEGGLAIDFGANQGFYTYYLAALGLQVHSFEIDQANFRSLQHGAEFNPREVADRVHLYPVGIGEKNSRFGMQGSNYEGYLAEGKAGPILGATFDCFAHHRLHALDLSKGVAFVKLDVEGFEIAVLRGAKHSLFRPGSTIGAMVMEVGPNRWGRSSHDFATGVSEMEELASHFKQASILVREEGVAYAKTCPVSLAQDLGDQDPRLLQKNRIHRVQKDEWKDLMKKMETKGYDCNFFYQN